MVKFIKGNILEISIMMTLFLIIGMLSLLNVRIEDTFVMVVTVITTIILSALNAIVAYVYWSDGYNDGEKMNNPCQCDYCKWRRKEITDLEYCQSEIDYLKSILDDLSVISTKEELNEIQECGWTRKNMYFYLADELDCLFEIQNEDCDRSEVSLLFKSLGGDDLINKIRDLTK